MHPGRARPAWRSGRRSTRRARLLAENTLAIGLVVLIFAGIGVVQIARRHWMGPDSPSVCIGSSVLLFGTMCEKPPVSGELPFE